MAARRLAGLYHRRVLAGLLAENATSSHVDSTLAAAVQQIPYRTSWLPQARRFSTAAETPVAVRRGPVSYASLVLTLATGGGILYYFNTQKAKKLEDIRTQAASVGKAAIGGPFQLVDQTGKPFSDKNLLGKFALLYFGFTYCPDICPDELEKVAQAISAVEKDTGIQVQPVFISIDPERDSVPQVREYVKEFHPRMIGLTGTMDQVKAAARAYRVYFTKTDDEGPDYLVDHSIIEYLIDPKGEFVTFYGKNFTAKELAESMKKIVTSRTPASS
ncbi:hypothetical protein WJX72_010700 [[Myrmecia] bisecta]|uniref:Thioredoxin domain-containing protein n=1 Tax=[Myrmecia] bisecta TaxID=41462 RepID=A0AAW1PBA2_9CHLO